MRHAVTVVVFGSDEKLLQRTIVSALTQSRPPDELQVLVSGGDIENRLLHTVERACSAAGPLTTCHVLARPDNLGFAGGHNYLAARAFGNGAGWVTLLNPDLELGENAFEHYWKSVEQYQHDFAIHGPQLVSGPSDRRVIDSAGIVWTRDARHFDAAQGQEVARLGDRVRDVEGVSGAVLTLSRASYARLVSDGGEFLDDMFLAFREDAELGVRVRAMGGRCLIHPSSRFRHERGARNAERTSALQRCLSVQNRFLLRSRLGAHRPGGKLLALARDLFVLLAVVWRERTSLPGLRRAWAVRRYERYKQRAVLPRSHRR